MNGPILQTKEPCLRVRLKNEIKTCFVRQGHLFSLKWLKYGMYIHIWKKLTRYKPGLHVWAKSDRRKDKDQLLFAGMTLQKIYIFKYRYTEWSIIRNFLIANSSFSIKWNSWRFIDSNSSSQYTQLDLQNDIKFMHSWVFKSIFSMKTTAMKSVNRTVASNF